MGISKDAWSAWEVCIAAGQATLQATRRLRREHFDSTVMCEIGEQIIFDEQNDTETSSYRKPVNGRRWTNKTDTAVALDRAEMREINGYRKWRRYEELTDREIERIVKLRSNSISFRTIGEIFHIDKNVIRRILREHDS